jgi:Family of unknown function (DUF6445)
MAQQFSIERVGREGTPVVVIDDFVPRPKLLENDAAMLGFAPMGVHYPGVRAVVPPVLVRRFVEPLTPLIAQVFGVRDYAVVDALYSLVTTPPEALAPIQRLPHFDGVEPERLALLHFLGGALGSGTAFYRHRATGFETVTAARLPDYERELECEVTASGIPQAAYIDGDSDLFEQIALFEARYNRAILYPSNALHCARIPEDQTFSADPAIGRLTVNTFLMGRA